MNWSLNFLLLRLAKKMGLGFDIFLTPIYVKHNCMALMSTPSKTVNVEIYADIICPWCYIGKKRLDAAFAARSDVTPKYIWRGFLLNPGMPAEGMDRQAYLNNKFVSAAAAVYGRIAAAGLDSGICLLYTSPSPRDS